MEALYLPQKDFATKGIKANMTGFDVILRGHFLKKCKIETILTIAPQKICYVALL